MPACRRSPVCAASTPQRSATQCARGSKAEVTGAAFRSVSPCLQNHAPAHAHWHTHIQHYPLRSCLKVAELERATPPLQESPGLQRNLSAFLTLVPLVISSRHAPAACLIALKTQKLHDKMLAGRQMARGAPVTRRTGVSAKSRFVTRPRASAAAASSNGAAVEVEKTSEQQQNNRSRFGRGRGRSGGERRPGAGRVQRAREHGAAAASTQHASKREAPWGGKTLKR